MFPLGLEDISLLFVVIAIILLVSSEMLSSRYGNVNIRIDKKKLRYTAVFVVFSFLATVAIRIVATLIPL